MVLTRNNNIDLIKLYACICVVALHTIPKDLSAVTTTIYYLSGVAVPLFFMSSGYFLLNRGEISIKYTIMDTKDTASSARQTNVCSGPVP